MGEGTERSWDFPKGSAFLSVHQREVSFQRLPCQSAMARDLLALSVGPVSPVPESLRPLNSLAGAAAQAKNGAQAWVLLPGSPFSCSSLLRHQMCTQAILHSLTS